MKTNKEELLQEVLEDIAPAPFRRDVLDRTLTQARQRRNTRTALRAVAGIMALALLAALTWSHQARQQQTPSTNPVQHEVIAGTSIEVLSDQELLAIFKSQPVGLFGEPGNQKLVVGDRVY